MKTLVTSSLLVPVLLALGGCGRGPSLDVRTFTLQNRTGFEAADLISPYVYTDRETNPGAFSATGTALSVRETPDNLDKIARVLEEFDQPVQGLRLRFQLIEADSFQGSDPAIAEVTEQLRKLFRFEGYRLRAEALVTVSGGPRDLQETRQRFMGVEEALLEVTARIERAGVVRLDPVRLWTDGNGPPLETSITVRTGQTLVIGGAGAQEGEGSYILTVTAEPQ